LAAAENRVSSAFSVVFISKILPTSAKAMEITRIHAGRRLKQHETSDIRRKRHIGNFRAWQDHNSYQKAFTRLLRDLKGEKPADAAG
jgi:hypothetical protein